MDADLARYLSPRLANGGEVVIRDLARIPGGASRETWMFDAAWAGGCEPLVLRLDPPASVITTDREVEWAFYQAFGETTVPVPRMRWLEPDSSHLGGPFFIMERLTGIEAQPRNLMMEHYAHARPRIAQHLYEILADIHAFDWRESPVAAAADCPAPADAWKRELDYWERVVDDNELSPQPIVRAGIRWLRANPPPPPGRVTVVHGDFRVGNVLCRPDGEIAAVVDWEMAHLGDPIEDLAWSFNEAWHWAKDGRPGGVIDRDEAVALYERLTGTNVDPHALRWWTAFGDVKCQAIWLTATRTYHDGRSNELMLPVLSYTMLNPQDQALIRSLGRWR